jgi:hypothetical protein
METLFVYLLKSSGLIIAFFLTYHLLLRKEAFFTSNRWFLIAGLITSVVLPLFFIKKIIWIEKPKFTVDDILLQSNQLHAVSTVNAPSATTDWTQIITIGYILVVLFLISKVIVNIVSLFRLLRNKLYPC